MPSVADKATPRSSITMLDPRDSHKSTHSDDANLDEEIRQDELDIERYGGDAPNEPTPKTETPVTFAPPPVDPNCVTWDGPDDPANPQNWSTRYKWWITIVCSIMTINVTFASSAPTVTAPFIKAEFGISNEISYLITSVFLLGYVFGPLFWGPGSELVGRRPVFMLCMTLYTIFNIGQALAHNIETLLITRFLSGFFAVAPLTNCGGVIADVFSAEGRGLATSVFSLCVFLGPVLGPVVSSFVVESYLGWRWVYWVMMIFAGACTIVMFIFLPETYAPILLMQKTKRLRKTDPEGSAKLFAEHEKQDWSFKGVLHRTLFRPFIMLVKEPILFLVTIYLSLIYGILYALFEAFPIVFITVRHMSLTSCSLIFIGVGIGVALGSATNHLVSRHYPELIKQWRGFPPAEERLIGAMIGSCTFVIGIFWLGWTGNYASIPWYVPGISTIILGYSIALVFISFLSYLVETYLMYAASAFAASTIIRSATGAAFPLFTVQMFTNLGINWACTLLGLLSLLLAPSPFLFYKYGPRIRERSTFAPCIDLKIAKILAQEKRAEEAGEKAV